MTGASPYVPYCYTVSFESVHFSFIFLLCVLVVTLPVVTELLANCPTLPPSAKNKEIEIQGVCVVSV